MAKKLNKTTQVVREAMKIASKDVRAPKAVRDGLVKPVDKTKLKELLKTKELMESGYAGIMPNGNIVDRRKNPKAIPIQANSLFNTPEPKMIKKGRK